MTEEQKAPEGDSNFFAGVTAEDADQHGYPDGIPLASTQTKPPTYQPIKGVDPAGFGAQADVPLGQFHAKWLAQQQKKTPTPRNEKPHKHKPITGVDPAGFGAQEGGEQARWDEKIAADKAAALGR